MNFLHLIRVARTLSFRFLLAKGLTTIWRVVCARWSTCINAYRCTYPVTIKERSLRKAPTGFRALSLSFGKSRKAILLQIAERYVKHEFNILGSGWIKVTYGISCKGFLEHAYPPFSRVFTSSKLTKLLSPGNRAVASALRPLISSTYLPIDWQLDFRSGYRWDEGKWSTGVLYGQAPGVDIKIPWELARMQHLPLLAMASECVDEAQIPAYRRECLDQILDFIAANPPGYGVNWVCTMDVAIRAANMAVVCWLLEGVGYCINSQISKIIAASLLAHGRHIMQNLEWEPKNRGNHYLSNICGLAFLTAALEPDDETRPWWSFAKKEFFQEVKNQFQRDGSNFEASTCYHRLSSEMVVFTAALFLGRDGPDDFFEGFTELLRKMANFTKDVTKPNGRVAQIGDNDSGRMFKLSVGNVSATLAEDHLNHLGLIVLVNALLGEGELEPEFASESEVIRALAGERSLVPSPVLVDNAEVDIHEPALTPALKQVETKIYVPNAAVLDGLKEIAYPDFGLYIWRSELFFMSIRCGSIGQGGRGGHAHNDQLAVELNIEGEDWLADPGSYTYTASIELRNLYRSAMAHAVPRQGDREPASLNCGVFRIENRARAKCLKFNSQEFEGWHVGFGTPIHRAIRIGEGCIRIRDAYGGAVDWQAEIKTSNISSALDLRDHFDIKIKFSPGYGLA